MIRYLLLLIYVDFVILCGLGPPKDLCVLMHIIGFAQERCTGFYNAPRNKPGFLGRECTKLGHTLRKKLLEGRKCSVER